MKKTNHYDIVCPKCKATIHIPYYKNLEAKPLEEVEEDFINSLIELQGEERGMNERH